MFVFRLSGLFLLRYAHRALSSVLLNAPPRRTTKRVRNRPRKQAAQAARCQVSKRRVVLQS